MLNFVKPFEFYIDDFKEIHIDIADAHFTLLADQGIDKLGNGQKKDSLPLHFHSYYEIFYIREGNLEINFEQNSIDLKKDNLIVLSPKIVHSTKLKSEHSSRFCISIFIEKNLIKTEHSLYNALIGMLSKEYIYVENAISVYESIRRIADNIACENHFLLSFYFHQFILGLMDITGYQRSTTPEELLLDSSVSRTYKIQRIISSYYMEDISLEFIAACLHLSTRQLNRIVQDFYGCTYREIIARTKIKAAADLLITSNMPISEISVKVGYHSLRGFYSAFKKYYNCLPTKYRKTLAKA